jgi:hypothetical protein
MRLFSMRLVILNPQSFTTNDHKADMLLDGSYLNDIEEILTQIKLFRRELIRNGSISVATFFTIIELIVIIPCAF